MSKLLDFDLRTLEKLGNGNAVRQFEALLTQCLTDIDNRQGDKRARKLKLQIEVFPKTHMEDDEHGKPVRVLDGVGLRITMDAKLPTRQTIDYDCALDEGRLLFNPWSPTNWRQQSLLPTIADVEG
jgi:hypothetical protein